MPRLWRILSLVAGVLLASVFGLVLGGKSNLSDAEPAALDLADYQETFSEEFNNLDVSAWGPGTRWIAHTPWSGDFGDAQFADPTPGFPFTTENGILRIEARKGADGKWRSGLLASTDPKGNGFLQQFGYFEMRAKLPKGPGVWPAFWLIANQDKDSSAEIDILEHYGVGPDKYESVVHVWPKEGRGRSYRDLIRHDVPLNTLYDSFHTFGAKVDADWIVFYFDRTEVGRTRTPPEHHRPMFMLLNLALGGGWPTNETPNPSYMYVDYVKAWAKKPSTDAGAPSPR